MAGSTRNAAAICAVDSPATWRRVRETCTSRADDGGQQVDSSARTSASTARARTWWRLAGIGHGDGPEVPVGVDDTHRGRCGNRGRPGRRRRSERLLRPFAPPHTVQLALHTFSPCRRVPPRPGAQDRPGEPPRLVRTLGRRGHVADRGGGGHAGADDARADTSSRLPGTASRLEPAPSRTHLARRGGRCLARCPRGQLLASVLLLSRGKVRDRLDVLETGD